MISLNEGCRKKVNKLIGYMDHPNRPVGPIWKEIFGCMNLTTLFLRRLPINPHLL